jgi:hypothetical protein
MPTTVYDASLVTHYRVARTLYGYKAAGGQPEQTKEVSAEVVLQRTQGQSQVVRDQAALFNGCACTSPAGGM